MYPDKVQDISRIQPKINIKYIRCVKNTKKTPLLLPALTRPLKMHLPKFTSGK